MALYLVRHDRVKADGACYGQTDLPSAVPYAESAKKVLAELPPIANHIISSPLTRCASLAKSCFPERVIQYTPTLAEINFGDWENVPWASIPRMDIDRWAAQPVNFQFPNGESTEQFSRRVAQQYRQLNRLCGNVIVFTHAGVIRKMLALHAGLNWADCLQKPVDYLSITHLTSLDETC